MNLSSGSSHFSGSSLRCFYTLIGVDMWQIQWSDFNWLRKNTWSNSWKCVSEQNQDMRSKELPAELRDRIVIKSFLQHRLVLELSDLKMTVLCAHPTWLSLRVSVERNAREILKWIHWWNQTCQESLKIHKHKSKMPICKCTFNKQFVNVKHSKLRVLACICVLHSWHTFSERILFLDCGKVIVTPRDSQEEILPRLRISDLKEWKY